eukprot:gene15954-biopygen15782
MVCPVLSKETSTITQQGPTETVACGCCAKAGEWRTWRRNMPITVRNVRHTQRRPLLDECCLLIAVFAVTVAVAVAAAAAAAAAAACRGRREGGAGPGRRRRPTQHRHRGDEVWPGACMHKCTEAQRGRREGGAGPGQPLS